MPLQERKEGGATRRKKIQKDTESTHGISVRVLGSEQASGSYLDKQNQERIVSSSQSNAGARTAQKTRNADARFRWRAGRKPIQRGDTKGMEGVVPKNWVKKARGWREEHIIVQDRRLSFPERRPIETKEKGEAFSKKPRGRTFKTQGKMARERKIRKGGRIRQKRGSLMMEQDTTLKKKVRPDSILEQSQPNSDRCVGK